MTYNSKEFGVSDLAKESLQDLNFARRYWMPKKDGTPVSPSTMQRWTTTGIDGVRLSVVYVGRKPHTSQAAIQRFFGEVTAKRAARLAAAEAAIEMASSQDLRRAGLLKGGSLPIRKVKK